MKILKLKKSGRVCYPFPWHSSQKAQPWPNTHQRVLIPLSEKEKINSKKTCHIQIIANSKLEEVRESRLTLR